MAGKRFIVQKAKKEEDLSLNEFFGKDVLTKAAELYEYVNRPLFKRTETGVKHRDLFRWSSEGVLDTVEKEYGKVNFVELVWIKVVSELRKFTVPLPLIVSYKKKLFAPLKVEGLRGKKEQVKEYLSGLDIPTAEKNKLLGSLEVSNSKEQKVKFIDLIIMSAILKRKPFGIAFYANGGILVIDRTDNINSEKTEVLNSGHYMQVSISKILSEFLRSDLAFKAVPELRLLTLAENKLYEAIKTGEYESISVHFKDKKIKSLELKKNEAVQRKIIDVLNENKFSEIVVKKHNGIVTKVEQNTKIHF